MIIDITSTPGFFYGLPSTYALVDALTYRLWLVDSTPDYLFKIKNAFVSKRNFVVVELSKDKIVDNKVDNSVIINWQFAKQYGIDYFPGKDSLNGFSDIVSDNSWEMIDTALASNTDIDLLKQLFLYHKLLVCVKLDDIDFLTKINDYVSRGLTISDMNNNIFDLANDCYSGLSADNARHLFSALPPGMKYE
jgi:hypothetical protein